MNVYLKEATIIFKFISSFLIIDLLAGRPAVP